MTNTLSGVIGVDFILTPQATDDPPSVTKCLHIRMRTTAAEKLARRFRGLVPVEAGPRAEQLPSYVRAMSALTDQLAQEILRGLIKLGKPTSRRAVEEARSHADDSERDDPR